MKGQFVSTITIFVLIFIISGNIFGAVLFQDTVRETVTFQIGDFNRVSEAQLKAETYVPRMEKELNYSSNIAALELGSNDRNWQETPEKQSVRQGYEAAVREELNSQSVVAGCQPPTIDSVNVEGQDYTASISDPWVVCASESTVANISLATSSLETSNYNNRYISLAESAVDLGNSIERLPESWPEGTGSESESCQASVDKSDANEEAKEEAREEAIEDEELASSALGSYDIPSWVGLDTDTDFSIDYEDDPETESCTYTVTNCEPTPGPAPEECESEERSGEEYSVTYYAQVESANLEYDLSDSQRQVINSNGEMETIHFLFSYVHDFE
ncbi:hypothetical protein GLU60_01080 [Nanohaloarchaea archaeon H01]|nr:hypothetical protein [Nanohaloarchaea archaeon H01]